MKYCKYCMSEIDQNAIICPNCRKKQNKPNKKKIVIAAIILSIIAAVVGCIFWYKSKINNTNQVLYLSDVLLFYNRVADNGVLLEDIGNDIVGYWYDKIYNNKYESIDDAVAQALKDNDEKIQDVKTDYNTIYNRYTKLLTTPNDNSNIVEIRNAVKEVYSNYKQLYNLVTSPTGSYNDFKKNFNQYDTDLAKSLDNLSTLIEIEQNK